MHNNILKDCYGRSFSYLRLSLTQRCNFKCLYCLPNGFDKIQQEELSLNEIVNLASAMVDIGIKKIRLTGGEPTLKKDFFTIVETLKQNKNLEILALTTNGFKLKENAQKYYNCGIDNINLSVDSLDTKIFKEITSTNQLNNILSGIEECLALGFKKVKINTVLLKNYNYTKLNEFLNFIQNKPIDLRFIALMPTKDNQELYQQEYITSLEFLDNLQKSGWKKEEKSLLEGPAQTLFHNDYLGKIGFINPYSSNFCKDCNRLRIDSFGNIMLCLLNEGTFSLRKYLNNSEQKEELQNLIIKLLEKKTEKNKLNEDIKSSLSNKNLSHIGG